MNIQQRTEKCNDLRLEVSSHPMCYNFIEDGLYIVVEFPSEVRGLGGIRITKENGIQEALEVILGKLEKFWRLDNPVLYPKETI